MRSKAIIGTACVLLLAALALPVASAGPVDGGEYKHTIEEQRVRIHEQNEHVIVDLNVSTGRHEVYVDGPSCYFQQVDPMTALRHCNTGEVETHTRDPTVDMDVKVAALEQTSAEPEPEHHVTGSAAIGAHAPATLPNLVIVTAAAGAGALTLYGLWRGLKLLALAGFVPMYSYISDENILDDPNRRRIFELIRSEPGASTKDVADRLGLAWGTATHHLAKLEKRRMIVSRKYGKYRRYFANGAVPQKEGKETVAVLRVPQTAEVARFIREHPGFSQKEVGARMGVSASTVLWHVKRLHRVGLVEKVRDGKRVKYYPTPALKTATRPAPAAARPREEGPAFFTA